MYPSYPRSQHQTNPPPTYDELRKAQKWRLFFAIFLCMLAFATLAGVLMGWLD